MKLILTKPVKRSNQFIHRFRETKTGDWVLSCWMRKSVTNRAFIMSLQRGREETGFAMGPILHLFHSCIHLYLNIWDHSLRVPGTRDALQGSDKLTLHVPIYNLFNDTVSSSAYISTNGIMISEWIWKDVDGSGRDLFDMSYCSMSWLDWRNPLKSHSEWPVFMPRFDVGTHSYDAKDLPLACEWLDLAALVTN